MIKGRFLPAHSLVSQREEKGLEVAFLLLGEMLGKDKGAEVFAVLDVAAAIVKFDDFLQAFHAAVMHVRAGQFDISEGWYLEGTLDGNRQAALMGECQFRANNIGLGNHCLIWMTQGKVLSWVAG